MVAFHPATISQDWLLVNREWTPRTEYVVSTAYQWKVCSISGQTGRGQQYGPVTMCMVFDIFEKGREANNAVDETQYTMVRLSNKSSNRQ